MISSVANQIEVRGSREKGPGLVNNTKIENKYDYIESFLNKVKLTIKVQPTLHLVSDN